MIEDIPMFKITRRAAFLAILMLAAVFVKGQSSAKEKALYYDSLYKVLDSSIGKQQRNTEQWVDLIIQQKSILDSLGKYAKIWEHEANRKLKESNDLIEFKHRLEKLKKISDTTAVSY
jgi:hypothetical protein